MFPYAKISSCLIFLRSISQDQNLSWRLLYKWSGFFLFWGHPLRKKLRKWRKPNRIEYMKNLRKDVLLAAVYAQPDPMGSCRVWMASQSCSIETNWILFACINIGCGLSSSPGWVGASITTKTSLGEVSPPGPAQLLSGEGSSCVPL